MTNKIWIILISALASQVSKAHAQPLCPGELGDDTKTQYETFFSPASFSKTDAPSVLAPVAQTNGRQILLAFVNPENSSPTRVSHLVVDIHTGAFNRARFERPKSGATVVAFAKKFLVRSNLASALDDFNVKNISARLNLAQSLEVFAWTFKTFRMNPFRLFTVSHNAWSSWVQNVGDPITQGFRTAVAHYFDENGGLYSMVGPSSKTKLYSSPKSRVLIAVNEFNVNRGYINGYVDDVRQLLIQLFDKESGMPVLTVPIYISKPKPFTAIEITRDGHLLFKYGEMIGYSAQLEPELAQEILNGGPLHEASMDLRSPGKPIEEYFKTDDYFLESVDDGARIYDRNLNLLGRVKTSPIEQILSIGSRKHPGLLILSRPSANTNEMYEATTVFLTAKQPQDE